MSGFMVSLIWRFFALISITRTSTSWLDLHHVGRARDVTGFHLADMHHAFALGADVDKRAEVLHARDFAR